MNGSGAIITITTDPNAPIMDFADYVIGDDLVDVVSVLIDAFE